MVTKRYIKRGGKTYGPYYYESYRDASGKVKKRYIPDYKPEKNKPVLPIIGISIAIIALFLIAIFFVSQEISHYSVTGRAIYSGKEVYQQGEPIIGTIRLVLSEGESIPADTEVNILLGDTREEFVLSDFVDLNPVEGTIYAEGSEISGEGMVFGIPGKKYQEVKFELEIYKEEEAEEEPQESPSEETQEEITEEPPSEEIQTEEPPEQQPEESEEPQTPPEESESPLTGQAITEITIETITGTVSYENPFTYNLKEGEKVRILEVESNNDKISEDEISIDITDNTLTVTTDYAIEGFGEDFQGEENAMIFEIDVSDLELEATPGKLVIDISYDGKEIAYSEETILVSETAEKTQEPIPTVELENNKTNKTEKEVKLLQEIPSIRIPYGENVVIELKDYFSGANWYSAEIKNIDVSVDGSLMQLTPEEFKGARKTTILAGNEDNSIESNEFLILVSSSAVNMKTTRLNRIVANGGPVKWRKEVTKEQAEEKINVEVPKKANNLKVKAIKDQKEEIIQEVEGPASLLTGNVVIEVKLDRKKEKQTFNPPFIKSFKTWFANFREEFHEKLSLDPKITGKTTEQIPTPQTEETIDIPLEEPTTTEYVIEYETPAPETIEKLTDKGKLVTITSEVEGYTDVIASTNIPNTEADKIRVYWHNHGELSKEKVQEAKTKKAKEVPETEVVEEISTTPEDPNNPVLTGNIVSSPKVNSKTYTKEAIAFDAYDLDFDGKKDYIEWVVPHLSNQTYEIIIEITNAEHLDENRTTLSDIYEQVKALDNIWSETIPENNYIRVTFEKELTSENDITIYPRTISGNPQIEVYEMDGTEIITTFSSLTDNSYNKEYLTGLQGSQETFDLKIVNGAIEVDHIIDPTQITWCYQETANKSAGCGDSPNGGYSFTYSGADWSPNRINLYDGNWSSSSGSGGITAEMYVNYTKARDANSTSIFTYKCDSTEGIVNFTMADNASCWSQSPLQFRVLASGGGSYTDIYCWQGTGWSLIDKCTSNPLFFEEAMIWYRVENVSANPNIEFGPATTPSGNQSENNIYIELNTSNALEDHYSFTDFNSDLMLWVRMDDTNSSGDPTDLSSYGNNGTLMNDALINSTGYFGNASHLDGNEDYISFNNANRIPEIEFKNNFTISLWVKTTDTGAALTYGYEDQAYNGYMIKINATGWGLYIGQDQVEEIINANSDINDGSWHHLVAIYDYENQTSHFYTDGQADGSGSYSSQIFYKEDFESLTIGGLVGISLIYDFNGSIDETLIFNRSLSLTEIQALYNASANQYSNNFTNISIGNYTFQGFTANALGNKNQTELRTVTINSSEGTLSEDNPPEITVISPVNGTLFNTEFPDFNVSLNENGTWCVFNINNGQNYTMTPLNNTYFYDNNTIYQSGTDYERNVTFICNDSFNNLGTAYAYYYYDGEDPSIELNHPTPSDNSKQFEKNVSVSLRTSDARNHYALVNFDSTLEAWLRFENDPNSGENQTHVYDWSGSGYNGTINGSAFYNNKGKFGKALTLSGKEGSHVIPSKTFNYAGFISVSAWIKTNTLTTKQAIWCSDSAGEGTELVINSTGGITVEDNGGSTIRFSSNDPITTTNWHHIVYTHDWLNGTERLYIDGNLENPLGSAGAISSSTNRIGACELSGSTTMELNGSIDEFMLFNRSLSLEEVQALYNASANQYSNNFTNLTEGIHTFKGFAVDAAGNLNSTELRTFSLDTTPPNINFTIPTTPNGTEQSNNDIFANLSTSDSLEHYSFVDLDNALKVWYRMESTPASLLTIEFDDTEDSWDNSSNSFTTLDQIFDENWTTYGSCESGSEEELYINYTIPPGVYGATYEIKLSRPFDMGETMILCDDTPLTRTLAEIYGTTLDEDYLNLTVNPGCLDNSDGTLRITIGFTECGGGFPLIFEEQVHWNISTTNLTDSSSTPYTGQVGDGKAILEISNGPYGKALELENRYIEVPELDNETNYNDSEFSASMWVKTNETNIAILSDYVDLTGDFITEYYGWLLSTDDEGELVFTSVDGGIELENSDGIKSISDNKWHHIGLIFKNNNATTYVDGSIDYTDLEDLSGNHPNRKFRIGSASNSTSLEKSNLSVDDILFFDRALTEQEMLSLYNSSKYQYSNNFTNLTEGIHTFKGFAVDAAGNLNSTELRTVTIDSSSPTIAFGPQTPPNNSGQNTTHIAVNVTTSDIENHYTIVDLDKDILFWMRGDDINSTGDFIDLSSYSRNASNINSGGQSTEGYFGKSILLNDTDSRIETGQGLDIQNEGQNITYAMVINPTSIPVMGSVSILFEGDEVGTAKELEIDSSGYLQLTHGGRWWTTESLAISQSDRWYKIAITTDGYNATFYIEGQGSETPGKTDGAAIAPDTPTFKLGHQAQPFQGYIEEVIIFNRTLSDQEINALWNASANQYYQNFTDLSIGLHEVKAHTVDLSGNLNSTETEIITDPTKPSIVFSGSSPSNGSSQQSTSVTLETTITDETETYSIIDYNNHIKLWTPMYLNSTGELTHYEPSLTKYATAPTNTSSTFGRIGNAIEFEGSNSRIEISNNSIATDAPNFTFAGWFKSTDEGTIYVERTEGSSKSIEVYTNNSKLVTSYYSKSVQSSTTITDNTWHHFVFIKHAQGTDTTLKLYIDGELESNLTDQIIDPLYQISTVNIGTVNSTSPENKNFEGVIDEFLIINRTLSEAEILNLYNQSGLSVNFTNLAEGEHQFTAYAVDRGGNFNQTSLSLTIEGTGSDNPDITFLPPTPNDGEKTENNNITIKVNVTTYNGTTQSYIRYRLFNSTAEMINETITNKTNITYQNLTPDTYTYNVYAEDSYGSFRLTVDRTFMILPSCFDLPTSCEEGSSCIINEECILHNRLCSGPDCDFILLTTNSKIHTLYDSNGNGRDLTLRMTSNTIRAPLTFLSGGGIDLSGRDGTDLGNGGQGGSGGNLNITVPDLLNTTNANFTSLGGYTTSASGAGGNGGNLILNFHGLIRKFTIGTTTPSLVGGESEGGGVGIEGSLTYNKDLNTCPRDADVDNDGRLFFPDLLSIFNSYNNVTGEEGYIEDKDTNCDKLINIIDLSKVGFEWGTR